MRFSDFSLMVFFFVRLMAIKECRNGRMDAWSVSCRLVNERVVGPAKASGSRVEQTYSRSGVYMMRLDASYETLHNANQILLYRGTVRVKSVVPNTRTFKYGFEWCSIECQKLFSSYNRNSNKKKCLWSSR